MKILIFGAGAVGSLLGGFLAKAGNEVSLLGRSWHIEAIRSNGLAITGIWGAHRVQGFKLFSEIGELHRRADPYDLIILTVKSFDTKQAVSEIVPLMSDKTILISFQNGLGNIETILEKIKPEQFLAGRIITGVEIIPGQISVTVSADALAVGIASKSSPIRSPSSIADLLNHGGIPARAVPNILTLLWTKVIYNCALNGPCSILDIPYGRMLESPDRIDTMQRIVDECYQVGKAKNIAFNPEDSKKYMKLLTGELIPKTAAHYPSMLGDLRKGRRTEIDALNGAICRFGQELGIETPENKTITNSIKSKESELRK